MTPYVAWEDWFWLHWSMGFVRVQLLSSLCNIFLLLTYPQAYWESNVYILSQKRPYYCFWTITYQDEKKNHR